MMVVFTIVATQVLKPEQVVMIWGLDLGVTIGFSWESFCVAVGSLVGSTIGLLSLQSTAMLLVRHTLRMNRLCLIGLVGLDPKRAVVATFLMVLGHYLGEGPVLVMLTTVTLGSAILHGAQTQTLRKPMLIWAIALALDPHSALHMVVPVVACGVLGVTAFLLRRNAEEIHDARRSSDLEVAGDGMIGGMLMVLGVVGLFVHELRYPGLGLLLVGLTMRYWGCWKTELVATRTGDLDCTTPGRVDGMTTEIVASTIFRGFPTSNWAAGESFSVMLIIAGCVTDPFIALLGIGVMVARAVWSDLSLRSERFTGMLDYVWEVTAKTDVARSYSVRDGHYVITKGGLHVGNGVGYGGTLHTSYHITGGFNVRIGEDILAPMSMSLSDDSVTYGGPWALAPANIPENGMVTIQYKLGSTGVRVQELQTGVVMKGE